MTVIRMAKFVGVSLLLKFFSLSCITAMLLALRFVVAVSAKLPILVPSYLPERFDNTKCVDWKCR